MKLDQLEEVFVNRFGGFTSTYIKNFKSVFKEKNILGEKQKRIEDLSSHLLFEAGVDCFCEIINVIKENPQKLSNYCEKFYDYLDISIGVFERFFLKYKNKRYVVKNFNNMVKIINTFDEVIKENNLDIVENIYFKMSFERFFVFFSGDFKGVFLSLVDEKSKEKMLTFFDYLDEISKKVNFL